MVLIFRNTAGPITVGKPSIIFPPAPPPVLTSFPTTNLVFDFSSLTGTSTTTSGTTVATWTDAITGIVAIDFAGSVPLTYHTDVTINSRPTLTGYTKITFGQRTTPQNSWTWYCVVRFATGGITGSLMLSGGNGLNSNTVRILYNNNTIGTGQAGVTFGPGPASSSGGTVNTWVPQANTNYIFSYICSGSNPNSTTSTQTYTFRINGVDYTPSANSEGGYYYIYNMGIGNDTTNLCYTGEQMMYSTNHSVATAQTMEQYLSYKWGIGIGATPTVATSSPYLSSVVIGTITYGGTAVGSFSGALGTTNGIVAGTASTYNVYAFGRVSTSGTYSINCTCNTASIIYVLAVGGGGGGASFKGGGGGGGGVYMQSVSLAAGAGTINISIGDGGAGSTGQTTIGANGTNTTVGFTAVSGTFSSSSITAYGGGRGAGSSLSLNANTGGSGGGGQGDTGTGVFAAGNTAGGTNYANSGMSRNSAGASGGGGGGAGASSTNGIGGSGILTSNILFGIRDFTPSGTSYGTYYWGGGGGGGCANTAVGVGNGGIGGGGGGSKDSGYTNANLGGTGGITNGSGCIVFAGGAGGANTGGGGGGGCTETGHSGGAGGSGIVIIAFPM